VGWRARRRARRLRSLSAPAIQTNALFFPPLSSANERPVLVSPCVKKTTRLREPSKTGSSSAPRRGAPSAAPPPPSRAPPIKSARSSRTRREHTEPSHTHNNNTPIAATTTTTSSTVQQTHRTTTAREKDRERDTHPLSSVRSHVGRGGCGRARRAAQQLSGITTSSSRSWRTSAGTIVGARAREREEGALAALPLSSRPRPSSPSFLHRSPSCGADPGPY
jgi:hypothetical protein